MRVGVDVVSIDRVAALVARSPRFVARVYTTREQRDCADKPMRWASSWAAKEAVRKLIASAGGALPAFRDIEIVRDAQSGPSVRIARQETGIALSLSHDNGIGVAVAATGDEPLGAEQSFSAPAGVILPARPDDGHKGTFGRVVVIAGASGYTGAPQLAAMGAARAGAGLVTLCVPDAIYAIVAARCLEVMPAPLPDQSEGVLLIDAIDAVTEQLAKADAAVVGPGLGRARGTAEAVMIVLQRLPCPAVIDADALNIAAANAVDWRAPGQPIVLTPHPAEMGRLIGVETAVVQAGREQAATSYAKERGAIVVLKGAGTVVAAPDGRVHVDAHRVVALATGGTGDVLAGVIGGLLAQRLDAFDAAVAGVTIHAVAGLRVQAERGRAGVLASDVVDALPAAQEEIRRAIERAR
jgi:hydroxyethylthiazole kinase-like uncharacterized protein yjeF